MLAITKDRTGRVILTTHGALDDEGVEALLEALALTDEDVPIVIDLTDAGELRAKRELGLLSALAFRSGATRFRGAHRGHARLLNTAECA